MVYQPREDSYLLVGEVEKRARGRVLDMGTGTGVQSLAALQKTSVNSVTSVDKDPSAVKFVKKMGLDCLESDLFENVEGKFDFIVFNPPYLPDDPKVKDIALDGGPNGNDLLFRFLEQCPEYLNDNGEVLFVQSSITGLDKTEEKLSDLGFQYSIVARQKIPWEELVVFSCKL